MEFKLQKATSTPKIAKRKPPPRKLKFPMDTMKVGEFFFVPNLEKNTISTYASDAGKKLGRKFFTCICYHRKTDAGWEACDETHKNAVKGVYVRRDA
jgi:hypothetical protein